MVTAPGPARSDWLVFEDDTRLETEGSWEVRGVLVVFRTAAGGSLSSVRLDTVDLEASRRLTERTSRPPAAERTGDDDVSTGAGESQSAFVITDSDVRHVGDEDETSEAGDDPESGDDRDPAADTAVPADPGEAVANDPAKMLTVVGWRAVPASDGQGVEIFGVLRNDGKTTVREISLTVRLLAEDDAELADSPATLSTRILGPAGQTNFRASFPGLLEAPGARFEVSGAPVP